jgi:HK97 family phage portal protein
MSIISRLTSLFAGAPLQMPRVYSLGSDYTAMSLDDPALAEFFRIGRTTSSGVVVNEAIAVRNSAMYRGVSLIASSLGMLPLHLLRKVMVPVTDEQGNTTQASGAEPARDHPLFRVLHKRPNAYQTPFDFKSFMTGRALFKGTAYAAKQYKVNARVKGGKEVVGLVPLNPDHVRPKLRDNWTLYFEYQPGNRDPRTIESEDMFWIRSPLSTDGITGRALLDVACETIGLAHQAERASGNVLKNGALVGGVLEHPKALDAPAIERLRTQFEERQASPENAGKWIVAEDGLQAKPFGSTLKDAQTNEQRSFQIEEMSRFTGVPRPLLMMDSTSWGTGIEQLGLFFITYCLLPWFIQWEEATTRSLLSEAESEEYFAKFNDGALLRGSLADQASFFSKALGAGGGKGWMTQDEVRDKFNLNPHGGPASELPQPVAQAAPGDNPDDPAGSPAGGGGSTGAGGKGAK